MEELYHYGVMGMKWVVRRYQNPDGTLTAEGRRHARKEYKEDNKKAFELGRHATVLGQASRIADKKLEKVHNENSDKYKATLATQKQLKKEYAEALKAVKENHTLLMQKYGSEAISKLMYDKNGYLNERVASGKEAAQSALLSGIGSALMTAAFLSVGSPLVGVYIQYPKSARQRGKSYYNMLYKANRKAANSLYNG